MKKRTLAVVLAAMMAMTTGVTVYAEENATEEKVTIKLGFTHSNPDREVDDEVMYAETFKEYVEANSDSITVELYPGNALGNQQDTVGAVSAGTVQMTIQNSSLLNNYDPNTMIFSMPGVFNNIAEVNEVVDSDWAKGVLEETCENAGIRVLGNSCTGMRSFTCKGRELRSVEDAKGLTFRVPDSPVYTEMVNAISANPVPMPAAEMYVAMQNGVVDGQENPIQNVVIDKTYEVQDWYVLDNHTPTVMSYMISDKFYNSLSDSQKEVIEAANVEATKKSREVTDKLEESGIATLEENGMTVYVPTEEELKGWHDAYGPVCEEYMREEVGDDLVDQLLTLLEELRG
ncbi:TRAP transporter substrate-binding protein [Blautia schinkii]|nr:TRAP transporter substrate-binding protein [Blautia schinkii]